MKKLIVLMCLSLSAFAQEPWELPVKNDMINFEFKEEFKNKKKDLQSYFYEANGSVPSKVNAELSGKGNKLLSNTTTMVMLIMDPMYMKKDTSGLMVTISRNKSQLKVRGVSREFNSIKCKIRVTFTANSYVFKVRGFVLTGSEIKGGKFVTTEEFLEEPYQEFLKDTKKSKSEKSLYTDLNEIVKLIAATYKSELDRAIKVSELD